MKTKLAYAAGAVVAITMLAIVSVGSFDFGRDLKARMTQPPQQIIINIGAPK